MYKRQLEDGVLKVKTATGITGVVSGEPVDCCLLYTSEMHLLRMAVQRSDADYFHLISGQDYPTRPLDYFLEFFNRNAGKEYIGYLHLPHPNWEDNTFRRLQYYYPYD